MPDSGYVAVRTGGNHEAFCNKKFKLTCMGVHSNYNELQPVRNDVYYAICATSVRTVFCVHSQSGQISLSFVPPGSPNRVPAVFWRNGGIVTKR